MFTIIPESSGSEMEAVRPSDPRRTPSIPSTPAQMTLAHSLAHAESSPWLEHMGRERGQVWDCVRTLYLSCKQILHYMAFRS